MDSFKFLIDDYKKRYVYQNGESKYNKIVVKINNSKTFISAINQSMNNNQPLLAGDYKVISDYALSFISGPRTAIMGQLIALEIWNNSCNKNYKLLDEFGLLRVATSCINSYGKGYS